MAPSWLEAKGRPVASRTGRASSSLLSIRVFPDSGKDLQAKHAESCDPGGYIQSKLFQAVCHVFGRFGLGIGRLRDPVKISSRLNNLITMVFQLSAFISSIGYEVLNHKRENVRCRSHRTDLFFLHPASWKGQGAGHHSNRQGKATDNPGNFLDLSGIYSIEHAGRLDYHKTGQHAIN